MNPVKVIIHGAAGRVGQVLISTMQNAPEIRLVGAVDIKVPSEKMNLADGSTIPFSDNLEKMLKAVEPDVMVDFSIAKASLPAIRVASAHKVNSVIGTTGFTAENLVEIEKLAENGGVGILLASNFALGAVLMMHFASLAAKYMDYAEIIELHHEKKLDAPSGTAMTTAKMMASARGRAFLQAADEGKNYPSRGEKQAGINVHSVRLPGLMAHQEVLLGGLGQTLSLRHDTISRECYTPGVLLAVQAVVSRKGFIQGLDKILKLG
ncbi:MAG TPA: 4-hydroxy-tetrahydrodipicolinate reductase [Dehalococcoidales bacterium]|nr:4-hydroxy-tetrahydrodipicolinate reductase [Dehalococcoidales bacterium]